MVDAKEFKVEDIQLVGLLTVQIRDLEQNPLENVRFNINGNNGNSTSFKTDKKGVLTVPANTEIQLSLVGIEI